ncbi:MAG TPA: hypothetical protein VI854_08440 [Acidimicrobiia bacterium]|nr:hypothetical protein [Acidimicrobiia bacterium]
MDFKFLVWVWVVGIILVVLLGGPVMVVVGMFFAWLAPWLIAGALALAFFAWLGRKLDQDGSD